MRCGNWHLVGALFVALALTPFHGAPAQDDCPNCVNEHYDEDIGYIDGGYGGASYDQGVAYATGQLDHGQCARKANYWYRPYTESSQADLFYNYYVPNSYGDPAAAYPAPFPTPSLVGHTYYTYQPLMPHEFLYHHHRSYHHYYNNGMGMNRTIVKWQTPPVLTGVQGVRKFFRLPR